MRYIDHAKRRPTESKEWVRKRESESNHAFKLMRVRSCVYVCPSVCIKIFHWQIDNIVTCLCVKHWEWCWWKTSMRWIESRLTPRKLDTHAKIYIMTNQSKNNEKPIFEIFLVCKYTQRAIQTHAYSATLIHMHQSSCVARLNPKENSQIY